MYYKIKFSKILGVATAIYITFIVITKKKSFSCSFFSTVPKQYIRRLRGGGMVRVGEGGLLEFV